MVESKAEKAEVGREDVEADKENMDVEEPAADAPMKVFTVESKAGTSEWWHVKGFPPPGNKH